MYRQTQSFLQSQNNDLEYQRHCPRSFKHFQHLKNPGVNKSYFKFQYWLLIFLFSFMFIFWITFKEVEQKIKLHFTKGGKWYIWLLGNCYIKIKWTVYIRRGTDNWWREREDRVLPNSNLQSTSLELDNVMWHPYQLGKMQKRADKLCWSHAMKMCS